MKSLFTHRWNSYLAAIPAENKDIYFTEEYVSLYGKGQAECFVYQNADDLFLFPYIKKTINFQGEEYFDFESAYGYSGPISNSSDQNFQRSAWEIFCSQARERKIIAGFTRFHPLLGNAQAFRDNPSVTFDRKTVAVDLTLEPQIIWEKQLAPANRRAIRKAQDFGLRYETDYDLKFLKNFITVYYATMQRVKAADFYLFDNNYFMALKGLKEHLFLGLVFQGSEIIAAALFFTFGPYGHYHLGGSLAESRNFRPNNFLFFQTVQHLKERGFKRFHLGGGTDNSSQNTLYQFKKLFSRDEHDFHIGKFIFNPEVYQGLCREWEQKYQEKNKIFKNFLLKYRY